jgi:hypothetical protein
LKVCAKAVLILIAVYQACATEAGLRNVSATPFIVKSGLEIARQSQGNTPASLHLVCLQNAELRLVVSTRLPAPRWSIGIGRDDKVSLFIGNVDHELSVPMELVNKGRNLTWLGNMVSSEGEGEPDTLVTNPLSANDTAAIRRWFGWLATIEGFCRRLFRDGGVHDWHR